MHVLPPALAFALGLALAGDGPSQAGSAMALGARDPGPPPKPHLHGPVLIVFDGYGGVEDVVEASGVAEAIAAIERTATAPAGPLMVLLVPVAGGEWEETCTRDSLVRARAVGA